MDKFKASQILEVVLDELMSRKGIGDELNEIQYDTDTWLELNLTLINRLCAEIE
jgi:hypothetical protein